MAGWGVGISAGPTGGHCAAVTVNGDLRSPAQWVVWEYLVSDES